MKKTITNLFLVLAFFFAMNADSNGQTHLWGTTVTGGAHNHGTIYKIKLDGSNFQTLYSLDSITGYWPFGKLLMANDGNLYGMTAFGGAYNNGVIYKFNLMTNIYTDIYDFDGTGGIQPYGNLIQATDGNLYGLTSAGTISNFGTLFSFDITTNTYTKLVDFISSNGRYPFGSLMQSNNGKLYGMTNQGGDSSVCFSGCGVIFSFDIFTNTYSDLSNFNINLIGADSFGSLIEASNGKLYGMTNQGGPPQDRGVIFSFDTTTNSAVSLFHFNDTLGRNPRGSLFQSANGKLYGLTRTGGMNNMGVLFSLDPANNLYTKLLDLDSTNGKLPYAGLMQASNGKLYGTTHWGGTGDSGVVFGFDINNNTSTVLLNFNGINGAFPESDFIEIPDSLTNGINQLPNKETIMIYPNPATSTLTLHSPFSILHSQFIITNILGEEIYHQVINNSTQTTIDVSQWSNGVYFYQIRGDKETLQGKFVIEK